MFVIYVEFFGLRKIDWTSFSLGFSTTSLFILNLETPSDRDWSTLRTKHPNINKVTWFILSGAVKNLLSCLLVRLNSPADAWPNTGDSSLGQDSAVQLCLKDKGHSFDDSIVHVLTREESIIWPGWSTLFIMLMTTNDHYWQHSVNQHRIKRWDWDHLI